MSVAIPAEPPINADLGSVPRRDFLGLPTIASAAIGVGAVAWPFIDSMNPAKYTLAAGDPVEVATSRIAPGQQIVVMWRGNPIFIMRRSPEALATLQSPDLIARL